MASPRSSLTFASTSGSLKCVVACTMALARSAGSADLKMPEPTNTASAPSCIMSAASAGVAMPPAEKFGTGSLPVCGDPAHQLVGRAEVLGLGHQLLGPERREPPDRRT